MLAGKGRQPGERKPGGRRDHPFRQKPDRLQIAGGDDKEAVIALIGEDDIGAVAQQTGRDAYRGEIGAERNKRLLILREGKNPDRTAGTKRAVQVHRLMFQKSYGRKNISDRLYDLIYTCGIIVHVH